MNLSPGEKFIPPRPGATAISKHQNRKREFMGRKNGSVCGKGTE